MDESDSSSLSSVLSSAPPSDDERFKLAPIFLKTNGKIPKKPAKKRRKAQEPPAAPASPPRPPRSPSPPHESTLADNPDIAFLVMFRSRFAVAFPPKQSHVGPQDIERGVEGPIASPQAENLLCSLLSLMLNRKKPVERGHHNRALEEAVTSQKSQWPRSWNGRSPISGSQDFNTMSPSERLNLLRTLAIWSLSTSDTITQILKDSYKQSRHEDDLNQPLSVQPWGVDGDKRRYWLVEGQDDTCFRLYRESPKSQYEQTWWSIAGSIEEIKQVADTLETKDTTQAARRLSTRITSAIPRFEATEEKRKRREYRQVRRAQFARPEPGFSLYEGRTRGKRMRYTYDTDDEVYDSDEPTRRRLGHGSDRSTPTEARGPVVTASGRQVRQREGGMYGETLLRGQPTGTETPSSITGDGHEQSERTATRATRAGRGSTGTNRQRYDHEEDDAMSDASDALSSAGWNSADNDGNDEDEADDLSDGGDGEGLSEDELSLGHPPEQSSLVVKLKVPSLDQFRYSISNGTETKDKPPSGVDFVQQRFEQATGGDGVDEEAVRPVLYETGGAATVGEHKVRAESVASHLEKASVLAAEGYGADEEPAPRPRSNEAASTSATSDQSPTTNGIGGSPAITSRAVDADTEMLGVVEQTLPDHRTTLDHNHSDSVFVNGLATQAASTATLASADART